MGGVCCPWSDAELKTHVHPLENATDQLLKIQGVSFEWKEGGRKDIGVIAQDVQKVYPQLVRNDKKYLQVDYDKLVAPLIESVRELNARIKVLEAQKAAH
ncbi:tail fiber domain-containing protein [Pseudomonas sp. SDO528_S397]